MKYLNFLKLLLRNKDSKKYDQSFRQLKEVDKNRFILQWEERRIIKGENTPNTNFDAHYLYHPAWAARVIRNINPEIHYDISSTIKFSTMLSAFIPVKFYDYRPAEIRLSNFESGFADLINLPFESNSIHSISCMHTVEHVGLGRYGDPLDYDGDIRAIEELKRVVAPNGNLLIVVPIGKADKIIFNAHRIYMYRSLISYFSEFHLMDFSLVLDNRSFESPSTEQVANMQEYGCGCYWFKKKENGSRYIK